VLPDTPFSQRANAVVREPELQKFWKDTGLYQKLSDSALERGAERFVLHDGPPYANGDLHCGHALNKILKDIVNRKQVLNGKQVHYVPGWDCHGLPIELKVLQAMSKSEREALTPVTLRQKAAAFAAATTEKQSVAFQRFGVLGDFDNPYLTLQPEFEAAQIGVFGEMFRAGYIFRGRKPVHWSPSSQTALAEAELEYPEGHVSKSIYVSFPVVTPSPALEGAHSEEEPVRVAVWTTTPWTMPGNLAVAVNGELGYSVVRHPKVGRLVVASELIDTLQSKLGLADGWEVMMTAKGEALVGTTYRHPLYDRVSPVLVGGDYITTESGTGLVHTGTSGLVRGSPRR
jgi:isoleucyl-tRNA synthetase